LPVPVISMRGSPWVKPAGRVIVTLLVPEIACARSNQHCGLQSKVMVKRKARWRINSSMSRAEAYRAMRCHGEKLSVSKRYPPPAVSACFKSSSAALSRAAQS